LRWRGRPIEAGSGSYLTLELGGGSAAASSHAAPRPLWPPYVEVDQLHASTEHARLFPACVATLVLMATWTVTRQRVTAAEGGSFYRL
jgi:hypothetical protein